MKGTDLRNRLHPDFAGCADAHPLDTIGNQRLEVGVWVQVGGKLDDGFFEDRRLKALRITRIVGDDTDAF